MPLFKFLRRLVESQRGNALVIGAATMPLMVGSAAVALDTIQLNIWKRQLQRAADSAALAGGHALAQEQLPAPSVLRDLELNNHVPLTGAPGIESPVPGRTYAVRVTLTSRQSLPFWAFFTGTPPTIAAEATAEVIAVGRFCMLSLYEGTESGIDVSGDSNVTLGCGMAANSQATNAITAEGSSTVSATQIMAVGGVNNTSNLLGNPELLPYTDKQSDPLAYLPNPPAPGNCTPLTVRNDETVSVSGNECFSSIDVSPGGTLLLGPGVYTVNGGDITLQGTVRSSGTTGIGGVTFVMTGPNGLAGDLKINAQAELNLHAPTRGLYEGVLFYRDRRASNIEISINGGANSVLEGALYFPQSDIKFAGDAGMNVQCMQLIGQRLKFRGSANITNHCPPGSGSGAFAGEFVRLVS